MNEPEPETPFRLDDRVVLVTGGGSGIGEQIARLFARQGAAVVVGDRDGVGGLRVTETIIAAGGFARYRHLDVTDASSVEEAVQDAVSAFGGLHILVNNAGIGFVGNLMETEQSDFDAVMAVNVTGVFLCARAAVRHMAGQGGGIIVNIASVAGIVAVARRFAYGASKGAVIAMTKSMAIDLIDAGIRVNCICPGTIQTPFVEGYLDRFHKDNKEETRIQLNARQPLGRLGRPEEVAHAALYLVSDEAAFATGSALILDGGLTAR